MAKEARILIVGAGLSGATIARQLAEAGLQVLVIDKRDHVAGNAYDVVTPEGIRVHKYGPHIFHTSNREVFEFLSRFTDWLPYRHRVRALLPDGREVVMPPNLDTRAIVGEDRLIDVLYRPYTRKMWGVELEEIDPGIAARVKARDDHSDAYFPDDEFQFMPKLGYTVMVENMLDHANITCQLGTEFDRALEASFTHIFNTMPIDAYFDYCLGELPYRSIRFHQVTLPVPRVNAVATVNFTDCGPYTR
ncbi:MAG: FAD-dependent oxidoreductase, partial [Deltaproteobacteria bacterium]